jgi:vancomycin resistance protein YoaR
MDTAAQPYTPERAATRTRSWVRIAGTIAIGLVLLLVASGVALTVVAHSFAQSGLIARNVFVENVPVAGRTADQAVQTLRAQWAPTLPTQITLTYPGGQVGVPTEDLGVTLQLEQAAAEAHRVGRVGSLLQRLGTQLKLRGHPVHVAVACQVAEAALDQALGEVAKKVNRPPRNARADISGDDQVKITPEIVGVAVDVAKSKAALLKALTTPRATQVALTVTERKPSVTKEDLAYLETMLSSYTTRFDSGQEGRTQNLTLAAQAMDHTVIKPGGVFSLNGIVGERLPSRGYRKAPIFGEGGTLIDDYGGGVCQVTSTTYNAALLADMAIVERSPHIRTVTYVPLGRDSMVSYGGVDLKWRNSLEHPVLVLAQVDGRSLTVTIIGKRTDKREVRIERSGVATIDHGRHEVKDPNLDEGKHELEKPGWNGGQASVRRLVKVGDKWKCDLSYSDSYPRQDDVVRVGTKKKPKPGAQPTVPTVPGAEAPGGESTSPTDTTSAVGAEPQPKAGAAVKPKPSPRSRRPRPQPAPKPGDFEAP